MKNGPKNKYTAIVEGRPVITAIASACLAIVVITIEGLRLGRPLNVIVWTAFGWGALFGIIGAFYPRIRRFFKQQGPLRRG
jgi:hypothetical protein